VWGRLVQGPYVTSVIWEDRTHTHHVLLVTKDFTWQNATQRQLAKQFPRLKY